MVKVKRNLYLHSINLSKLRMVNTPREEFRTELERIPYLGYEVENLLDGRKIVISKPGGKSVYGNRKKEDFFVFIFNPENLTLWQISHKQIQEDIREKANYNAESTKLLIELLKSVHRGEEPDELLLGLDSPVFDIDAPGEPVDALLKVYKWIWGQEDVNYPNGEGRDMSLKGITEIETSITSQISSNKDDAKLDI